LIHIKVFDLDAPYPSRLLLSLQFLIIMLRGVTLLLVLLLLLLLPWLFLDVILIALGKLGIAPSMAPLIVLVMFVGSLINIPVLRESVPTQLRHQPLNRWGLERYWPGMQKEVRERIIAINVGGFVVPILLVVYEVWFIVSQYPEVLLPLIIAVLNNIFVCYLLAQPVPNIGITLPTLVPGVVAAISAVLLAPTLAPPVAFCAGVLGPVIGADLIYLKKMRQAHVGLASIGGAGTFDGIVISGLLAVLLA
jgi:uncharacterized membrane protein